MHLGRNDFEFKIDFQSNFDGAIKTKICPASVPFWEM